MKNKAHYSFVEKYWIKNFGLLPKNWSFVVADELFSDSTAISSDKKKYPLYSLTIEHGVTPKTDRYEREFLLKDAENNDYKIVKNGQLVFNPMNLRFGAIAIAKLEKPVLVSGYYNVLTIDKKEASTAYLISLLKSSFFRYLYETVASGSLNEKKRVHWSDFRKLQIPLPSEKEQDKIAKIISTWDDVIEKMESLLQLEIVKKNSFIKKEMNSLLKIPTTELKKLSEVCIKISAGATPSTTKPEYWNGDIPWMNSGEINQKIVRFVEGRITEKGLRDSSTKIIPKYSVLMALAGQGKTRGTVAVNEIEVCTNQSLAALIPGKEINYLYLYYNLDTRYDELRRLSTGDGGRGGLNLKIINDIMIPVPLLDLQIKIVAAAEALDKNIELLKKKKNYFQLQRLGIAQQLLTGKKRVKT